MEIISRLDLLVAMRLHALIFAAATQVPAVGVSYAGQPSVPASAPGTLSDEVARAWAERDSRAEDRATAQTALAAAAEANFEMVQRLCRPFA